MKKINKTNYRVIYGDTDKMGIGYHANYFRWFEIGRGEFFRTAGIVYSSIEEKGIFLPVSEVFCKFMSPVRYDDLIIIETCLDKDLKVKLEFEYRILSHNENIVHAVGFTKHVFLDKKGRVIRPPKFLKEIIMEL